MKLRPTSAVPLLEGTASHLAAFATPGSQWAQECGILLREKQVPSLARSPAVEDAQQLPTVAMCAS